MRWNGSATAACCLIFATITIAASNTLDSRTSCYSGVFTLVSRGSDEAQGQSVLETIASAITDAIPNSGSNEVVYPAASSFWDSAPVGITNAQQQMQDYYSDCPDGKMVLLGYSQGSYVLANSLAGANVSGQQWSALDSNIGNNIAAVVLFGDQTRVPGQGTVAEGTNCATACNTTSPLMLTSSYASAMSVYSDRLEEWCDDADPVCCKTGWDISAHLSYWSDNTTDTVVQFVQSKVGDSASSSSASSTSATSTSASATGSSTTMPSGTSTPVADDRSSASSAGSTGTAPTSTDFTLAASSPASTSASPTATSSTSGATKTVLSPHVAVGWLALCLGILSTHIFG